MSEFDAGVVVLPLRQAQLLFLRQSPADFIWVRFDDPDKAEAARDHAITAAALADDPAGAGRDTVQIFGQVRSTAVDLRRAAAASVGADEPLAEAPTEELLLADAPPSGGRLSAPERAG